LGKLGVLTKAKPESLAPAQRLQYHCAVGPIDLSDRFVAVGGVDGGVNLHEIWEGCVREGRIQLTEPRLDKTGVAAVSFSRNGGMLAAAWANGEVVVFCTASREQLADFQQNDCAGVFPMLVLAFSPDGSRLAVGGGTCATVCIHQISARTVRVRDEPLEKQRRVGSALGFARKSSTA